MVLVKNWQFFYVFNIGKIGQEYVFETVPERKNALRDLKIKEFKKWIDWFFPKGLMHGFGKKLAIFVCF